MTPQLIRRLRAFITTPAWAVHFHGHGTGDSSTACFHARCGRPPLSTDHRLPL